jgi:poly(hydroxyalkanoate) granule-associated protein
MMVRKLKTMAAGAGKDGHLAIAIKESAQQIWLAGLGAFSKAQEEGTKVFEALVREGNSIQKRTMRVTEDKVNEVTSRFTKMAGEVQKQANHSWDKLESVFEERVERALQRLGVPTSKEVQHLTKRVEELTASVHKLGGGKAAKKSVSRTRRAAA